MGGWVAQPRQGYAREHGALLLQVLLAWAQCSWINPCATRPSHASPAAMGMALVERLRAAGMTFQVQERTGSTPNGS